MTCIFDAGVTQIDPSDSLIQNYPVNILESLPHIYARKMIATSKNRNWALKPLMIIHHVWSLSDWNSLEIFFRNSSSGRIAIPGEGENIRSGYCPNVSITTFLPPVLNMHYLPYRHFYHRNAIIPFFSKVLRSTNSRRFPMSTYSRFSDLRTFVMLILFLCSRMII